MGTRRNYRETEKHFKLKENENTTYPNLQDAATAALGSKCTASNVCIRKNQGPKSIMKASPLRN